MLPNLQMNILLETNSPAQSKSLLETTHWEDISIKINAHNYLNFCKGVIKTPDRKMCSVDEIVANLCNQGFMFFYFYLFLFF